MSKYLCMQNSTLSAECEHLFHIYAPLKTLSRISMTVITFHGNNHINVIENVIPSSVCLMHIDYKNARCQKFTNFCGLSLPFAFELILGCFASWRHQPVLTSSGNVSIVVGKPEVPHTRRVPCQQTDSEYTECSDVFFSVETAEHDQ